MSSKRERETHKSDGRAVFGLALEVDVQALPRSIVVAFLDLDPRLLQVGLSSSKSQESQLRSPFRTSREKRREATEKAYL